MSAALEGQDVARGAQEARCSPVRSGCALAAPVEEGAGGVERRAPGPASCSVDRAAAVALGDRQPGLAGGEAGLGRVRLPGHRRAAAVAAGEGGPEGDAERVLELLEGELGLLQPQLLALVEADRAAQGAQQHGHQPAQGLGRVVAAPAGDRRGGRRGCRTTSSPSRRRWSSPAAAIVSRMPLGVPGQLSRSKL